MEFAFATQDDAIQVVGQHNGEAVALPLAFPEPNIVDGGLQKLPVQSSNGDVTERACLVGGDMVIELGRKLKEAIYGFVHCACVLEKVEGSEHLYRRTPEVVAVKILIRTRIRLLAGRSQEDPMKVLRNYVWCEDCDFSYRKLLRYNLLEICTRMLWVKCVAFKTKITYTL